MKKIIWILLWLLIFSGLAVAKDFDEDSAELPEDFKISDDELVAKPNAIDEDDYTSVSLFDRPLFLAGELQFSSEFKGDYELDNAAKDDLLEIEPALKVEFFYPVTELISVFLENEVQYKTEYYSEKGDTENQWIYEPTESWVFVDNIGGSGTSLQIGRQNYEDERQWWWDERLDSIRLHYDRADFHSEIAAAQQLYRESTEDSQIDPENKNILRFLSHTAWQKDEPLRFDLFALYQDDHSSQPRVGDIVKPKNEDDNDSDLLWYGVRVSGDIEADDMGGFSYWVDAAGVSGDETLFEFEETDEGNSEVAAIIEQDVFGWGFDTGATWHTGVFYDLAMTVGYAWGAGDRNPESGTDRSFRQTGFNEGDKRFQYYGELLNPDLSNLQIITISAGFPIGEDSFIDFIYHHYRQDHPASFLWDSDLEADPEGISKSIGEEWDVAFTYEEWDNIEIESSAAVFMAGDAFGSLSGETAYRLKLEINYLF